jgi:hypothetical protein
MGIHKVAVKLGLAYTSNKEAELKLAEYIHGKFNLAAELFKSHLSNKPRTKIFFDCLMESWKENDSRKKFYVEDKFLRKSFPELCGKERPIEISTSLTWGGAYAETFHLAGKYVGMFICVGLIEKSKNEEELRKNLLEVISTIYHECDHVYFESECAEVEDLETSILYYLDKAEMRAHAKEIAFVYVTHFPNKSFNYKKLKEYVFKHYNIENKMHKNVRHVDLMRDPKSFTSSRKEVNDYVKNRILTPGHIMNVHKLKKAFRSYMNYITFFVKYFNEHPEHQFKH